MEDLSPIFEYYEELFPVLPQQKEFFFDLVDSSVIPQKVLSIGCGTGNFEHILSKHKCDVTGIDEYQEFLEAASRRRRIPGVNIRFFQMTTLEMARFLGSGFYTILLCLNNKIAKIRDEILMRKFFVDCKTLLAPGGNFILQLPNYYLYKDKNVAHLPPVQSIRSSLHTKIQTAPDGQKLLFQQVEAGNGKKFTIVDREPIILLLEEDINRLAMEAGFNNVEFFSNYNKDSFDKENSKNLICKIS